MRRLLEVIREVRQNWVRRRWSDAIEAVAVGGRGVIWVGSSRRRVEGRRRIGAITCWRRRRWSGGSSGGGTGGRRVAGIWAGVFVPCGHREDGEDQGQESGGDGSVWVGSHLWEERERGS